MTCMVSASSQCIITQSADDLRLVVPPSASVHASQLYDRTDILLNTQ